MGEAIRRGTPTSLVAWAPQPKQSVLIACPIFDVLYGGARGGGKTAGFIGDWLAHSSVYPGTARGLFIRRTLGELSEVQQYAQDVLPKVGATWRASRHEWVMPNGNVLRMRYLDRDADANNYQGGQYTKIYVDEAGNFGSPSAIDKLSATLRSPHGTPVSMRLSANPGGPGQAWIKERYIDPAPPMTPFIDPKTQRQRVYIPSRLQDNQRLSANDPLYEQRLRGVGPGWLVRAWLEGDWNATPEGGLIKGEWLQNRYRALPPYPERIQVVQSWDTAQKPNELVNDPSCCTTWLQTHNALYLLDCFVAWLTYPELVRKAKELYERLGADTVLIEDKASGTSLIQTLRNETTIPCVPIEPVRDKEFRLFAASGAFEAGLVWLPQSADWVLDYEIELTTFPLAPHDDRVDSTSQAIRYMLKGAVDLLEQIGTSGTRDSTSAYGIDSSGGSEVEDSFGFAYNRSESGALHRYGKR